jgi:hypothetical protein
MQLKPVFPPTGSTRPTPWKARLEALGRSPTGYLLVSLVLLAPCYWQARIQAGDLSSHIYNAWLARLIGGGRAPGLTIVSQHTNVLFDLLLAALFQVLGAGAAQRIAVALAVLIFLWGAFAFVSAVSGRRAWPLLPVLAMLAYGWVFHMGFFNFYISMGLCFWALALAWEGKLRRVLLAVFLLALACVAHGLAVGWTVCVLAYLWLARRISPRARLAITILSPLAMVLLHVVLTRSLNTRWSAQQVEMGTGIDQVLVYDSKYYLVLIALLVSWGLLFLELLRAAGVRSLARSIPFQVCLITGAGIFILPSGVAIPGFNHALVYIAERMSLGVGVFVCAILGGVRIRPFERGVLLALALVFFAFLYRDERSLNALEDRFDAAVAQLPPRQRVVSAINDPNLRINAVTHMIDRACIDRCFSYGNYEPSTAQFRIRTTGASPLIVSTYKDSWALQSGGYIVRARDVPLYQLDLDEQGRLILRSLKAGDRCESTSWDVIH